MRNLLRLMILSKLNTSARSAPSKTSFLEVVSEIRGCEAYIVNYGQPLLYAKYNGVPFTDQKVGCQFVRTKEEVIDVTVESMFSDFADMFDDLASSSQSQVLWGVASNEQQANPLFRLMDAFIDSVTRLSAIPSSSQDSLMAKRFAIRNATLFRKSLDIEFLVDGGLNIIQLNPAKRGQEAPACVLMSSSSIANAIVTLMTQA